MHGRHRRIPAKVVKRIAAIVEFGQKSSSAPITTSNSRESCQVRAKVIEFGKKSSKHPQTGTPQAIGPRPSLEKRRPQNAWSKIRTESMYFTHSEILSRQCDK